MSARTIVEQARAEGRTLLNEIEAKQMLEEAGVRVSPARLAASADDAARLADELGYPAVLKVVSAQITHKTDVGGVALGLSSADDVRAAFERIVAAAKEHAPGATVEGVAVQRMEPPGTEVIVGVTKDPQFGPVLMFGLGGVLVEVLKDVAFRVLPITDLEARDLVRGLRGYPILAGARGGPAADEAFLVQAVLRVGQMAAELPEIEELDINPLVVAPVGSRSYVVDARIRRRNRS